MLLRTTLFLSFLVLALSASIPTGELDEDWTLWKQTYGKSYGSEDSDEEAVRRIVWEANLHKIMKHNLEHSLGKHTHRLGMNRFGDWTETEFAHYMNGYKRRIALEKYPSLLPSSSFLEPANVQLPDAVDWREKGYVTGVKNQGQCQSCWAFSTTGSLEGQHYRATGELVSLSEQNLVDCSGQYGNKGCKGGLVGKAFQYIKENGGIDTEECYPYTAMEGDCVYKTSCIGATVSGFVDIPSFNETALQVAVATVGPVSVAIDASKSSFQFYESGVYNEPLCSTTELDHGVLAVGYGTMNGSDYWIIKNSWASTWGNNGYIYMSRNKANQCGIATQASYPLV